MLERPILFNAEMVRAILNGSKTQTRRVIKNQPEFNFSMGMTEHEKSKKNKYRGSSYYFYWMGENPYWPDYSSNFFCPYGEVADQLWVRETWRYGALNDADSPSNIALPRKSLVHYEADGKPSNSSGAGKVRVSIHMPRWASRIQLEITSVRVERLNDISEKDAIAEGVVAEPCDHARRSCAEIGCCGDTAKGAYQWLWESINGADSWEANPWVWVIEFKRAGN